MKRVLVTGGSGFIGINCVEALLDAGCQVLNLDVKPIRIPRQAPFHRQVNILDKEAVRRHVVEFQPSHLIHLAAETETWPTTVDFFRTNIQGSRNVLEASAACPSLERAVFVSTKLVTRTGHRQEYVEDFSPDTAYGESKMLMEKMIRTDTTMKCLWCIVRPSSIWGPWFGPGYLDFFQMVARRRYFNPGRIDPPKSFGYVENLVFQLMKIMDAPTDQFHRATFYLADYEIITIRQWANAISDYLGTKRVATLPGWFVRLMASGGDLMRKFGRHNPPISSTRLANMWADTTYLDLDPTKAVTGPLPYSLAQGVARTCDWMKAQNLF